MLVVKIELWPHGFGDEYVRTIATMVIANKGGSSELGDYQVATAADGSQPKDPHALFARSDRRGEVLGHPRLKAHVWNLVAKALRALGHAEEPERD
jgi:hypothetical protein